MNENPTTAKEKYDLAYHYYLDGNKNRSNYWFVEAFNQAWKEAEQGDAEAMYLVYSIYRRSGYGVYEIPFDGIKARNYLFKAAENGYAPAQYDLGYAYKYGWFHVRLDELGDKNETNAVYWFTKAVEQGHAQAKYELGLSYYKGNGVKDLEKAIHWLTLAEKDDEKAKGALIEAKYELGVSYYKGNGVPKDLEKAKYWIALSGGERAKEALAKIEAGKSLGGCYIATCVYGSYDCPEVWTLRRFRDNELSNLWLGRCFIRIYYSVSPKIVELFGNKKWFSKLWKPIIDKIVRKLQDGGIDKK